MTHQRQVYDLAERLGLTEPLAEARRFVERANEINAELAAFRAECESDHAGLISKILAGPVDRRMVEEQAVPALAWAHDGPGAKIMVGAVVAAHRAADQAVDTSAAALWEPLVAAVDEVIAAADRLRLPPGITAEGAARQAGLADRWAEQGVLLQRWHDAHALAGLLRTHGWVDACPVDDRELYLRYKAPNALPDSYWKLPGPVVLAAAVLFGAGPGLYTAQAGRERWLTSRSVGAR